MDVPTDEPQWSEFEPPPPHSAERDALLALVTAVVQNRDNREQRVELERAALAYGQLLRVLDVEAPEALRDVLDILDNCPVSDRHAYRDVRQMIVRRFVEGYFST
jgi:hypothetical protein